MSESVVFQRRDFLKLIGIGVAGAAAGCAQPPAERLIPYLVAPEDVLPGVPVWYASTCRECPTGCGILVKQREGRAIKIEGNPAHLLSRGGVCARGQAGLQGLYDPDRVKSPMLKTGGSWKPIAWADAIALVGQKLGEARAAGKGIWLLTDNATGSLQALSDEWAAGARARHLVYEAFGHESLREANRRTFGRAEIPHFDFGAAHDVVSFGADFLETWLDPVGHARGFAEMRALRDGTGHFTAFEPRLSLTGANADEWLAVVPGGEMAVALGMARVILTDASGSGVPERAALLDALDAWTPESVEKQSGIPAATVARVARRFAARRPSLAVAGGVAAQSEQSVALHAAVNLLNYAAGNVGRTVRFDRTRNFDAVAPFGEVQRLIDAMGKGEVAVALVHGADPVYSVPAWAGFGAAFDKVPFKVSLSGALDDTSERCDLVLPSTHALETLGDARPVRGFTAVVQPAMRPLPMFDARPAGQTLIDIAKAAGFGAKLPDAWPDYVKAQWRPLHQRLGAGRDFEAFWNDALAKGGIWEDVSAPPLRWTGTPAFAAPQLRGEGDLALLIVPSASFFDGRGANKPWLQELPDVTTRAVWGSWAEIHPETARKLGVSTGDPLRVQTEAGSVEVPAYVYEGIRPDTVAIGFGQGHVAYGRYAAGRGVNPLALLAPATDGASGAVAWLSTRARVTRASAAVSIATTQPNMHQGDREIAQVIPIAALLASAPAAAGGATGHEATEHGGEGVQERAAAQRRPGRNTEPRMPAPGETVPPHAVSAAEPPEVVRGPRQIPVTEGSYANGKHRWAMAIDLDSCNGCSACVVACSAENNVPTVGPDMIRRGREMMWIRIERYEERIGDGASDVRFVPMMCQHCTSAPCETVCPVYATYHNPEGLNAQIYNRCVGTRYCSNNCPYKVRSFNFFDYGAPEKPTFAFPEPLNWQLNPDVTVRSKGVMEKCTMCVQRILEGKGNAKDEDREVRDGEIQTACAQSCPTQAITFGDLLDPESRVAKLSHGERRYWVLNDLNTGPGVTYLKRVQRGNEAEGA